ncbi:MAG: hypothetical protein VW081_06670 [Nitrosopumilus sp.]|jgi:hypothetical protein|nr:MAG: hypothetical protein EA443_00175 [Nitrosopumilus sp.]
MGLFDKTKEKMKKDIDDALKHEKNLQHDENEEPVTYVDLDDAKSMEHEEHVKHDENEEPVTFADEEAD